MYTTEEILNYFYHPDLTKLGFAIRAHQYGVKEARRMQDEDDYLSEIACDLMNPEDQ
jgi:hypothetical protein